jgi:hypothetical protein
VSCGVTRHRRAGDRTASQREIENDREERTLDHDRERERERVPVTDGSGGLIGRPRAAMGRLTARLS